MSLKSNKSLSRELMIFPYIGYRCCNEFWEFRNLEVYKGFHDIYLLRKIIKHWNMCHFFISLHIWVLWSWDTSRT